jgi:hypothetical protein
VDPASNGNDAPDTDQRAILLFDNDLFFAVKIADTLKHVGYTTRTVRRLGDFTRALEEQPPQARDLGATSVIANSKLASDLPGVVARALRREPRRVDARTVSTEQESE